MRLGVIGLVAIMLSCGGCGISPATATANALASARARAADAGATGLTSWSGTWVTGSGADTNTAGGTAACMAHWLLTQDGPTFTLDADHNPDDDSVPQYLQFEHATGTLVNGTLTLTGNMVFSPTSHLVGMPAPQAITYVLTLDAAKGHLVGTRNGDPFWAVPFKPAAAGSCAQPDLEAPVPAPVGPPATN